MGHGGATVAPEYAATLRRGYREKNLPMEVLDAALGGPRARPGSHPLP
jgi:hypothetical protein